MFDMQCCSCFPFICAVVLFYFLVRFCMYRIVGLTYPFQIRKIFLSEHIAKEMLFECMKSISCGNVLSYFMSAGYSVNLSCFVEPRSVSKSVSKRELGSTGNCHILT